MLDFYTAVYTSTNYQAVCKLRPINLNTQSETLEYQLCIYTAWSYFRAQKIPVFSWQTEEPDNGRKIRVR